MWLKISQALVIGTPVPTALTLVIVDLRVRDVDPEIVQEVEVEEAGLTQDDSRTDLDLGNDRVDRGTVTINEEWA